MNMIFFNESLRRTECLMDLAMEANQSYRVLMQLREALISDNELINISPAFYSIVFRNTMQSLFVDISKVFYEYDLKETESCYSLLDKIKNNLRQLDNRSVTAGQMSHISYENIYFRDFSSVGEIVDFYLEELGKKGSIIDHLLTLRCKHFVHIDIKTHKDLEAFFRDNFVSLSDIEDLLVLFSNICIALYQYFKSCTFYPLAENHDDFEKTLRCLRKYKELSEKYDEY